MERCHTILEVTIDNDKSWNRWHREEDYDDAERYDDRYEVDFQVRTGLKYKEEECLEYDERSGRYEDVTKESLRNRYHSRDHYYDYEDFDNEGYCGEADAAFDDIASGPPHSIDIDSGSQYITTDYNRLRHDVNIYDNTICDRPKRNRKRSRNEPYNGKESDCEHIQGMRQDEHDHRNSYKDTDHRRSGQMHSRFSDASDEDDNSSSVSQYRRDLKKGLIKKRARTDYKPTYKNNKPMYDNFVPEEDLGDYLHKRPRSRSSRTKSDSSHTSGHDSRCKATRRRHRRNTDSSVKLARSKDHCGESTKLEHIEGTIETSSSSSWTAHGENMPGDTDAFFSDIVNKVLNTSELKDIITTLGGKQAVGDAYNQIMSAQIEHDNISEHVVLSRSKTLEASRSPDRISHSPPISNAARLPTRPFSNIYFTPQKRDMQRHIKHPPPSRAPCIIPVLPAPPTIQPPIPLNACLPQSVNHQQLDLKPPTMPDPPKSLVCQKLGLELPAPQTLYPRQPTQQHKLPDTQHPQPRALKPTQQSQPPAPRSSTSPIYQENPFDWNRRSKVHKERQSTSRSKNKDKSKVKMTSNQDQSATATYKNLNKMTLPDKLDDLEMLNSTDHLLALPTKKKIDSNIYCAPCKLECNNPLSLETHKNSLLHRLVTHEWWDTHKPPPRFIENTFVIWCIICHARMEMMNYGQLIGHFVSTRHQLNKRRWLEVFGPPPLHEWCVWKQIKQFKRSLGDISNPGDPPVWARQERVVPLGEKKDKTKKVRSLRS